MNPSQVLVGDIHKLNSNYDEYKRYCKEPFLVCVGPPCQGFSTVNRQRLVDDPRNVLYLEYLKFLKATKPVFFIMENVKGMLQRKDEILDDFHAVLGDEYNIYPEFLNAKDFSVPQNREHVIFIGNRVGIDSKSVFTTLRSLLQHILISLSCITH